MIAHRALSMAPGVSCHEVSLAQSPVKVVE